MGIRKRTLSLFMAFMLCLSILPTPIRAVETANRREETAPIGVETETAETEYFTVINHSDTVDADAETETAETEYFTAINHSDTVDADAETETAESLPPTEDKETSTEVSASVEDEAPAVDDSPVEDTSPAESKAVPATEQSPQNATELPEKETPNADEDAVNTIDINEYGVLRMKTKEVKDSNPLPSKGTDEFATLFADTVINESTSKGATTEQVIWTDSMELESGQYVSYEFTPSVSATYIFESVNATGDPVGWLEVPEGTQVVYSDDSGSANGNSHNFRISYDMTAGTTYYWCARWYGPSTSGNMEFQLIKLDESVDILTISVGQVVNVDIETAGQTKYLSFTPTRSGTYVLESINESGDTFAALYSDGPGQGVLIEDDDGGSRYNFSISYAMTANTTYYYGVRWFSSSSTGTITVQLTDPIKELEQPTVDNPVIDYEDVDESGAMRYFRFTPAESGTYVFESTNASGDPEGYLYADEAKSEQLAYNDDDGSGANFRISYEMESGHTYYYGVRFRTGGSGRIDVRLSITPPDNPIVPIILNAAEVTLRGFTTAEINPSDAENSSVRDGAAYFAFTPEQSGTYLFESVNDSSDPIAYLYSDGPGEEQLASDDDSGNANNNSRNFRLSYWLTEGTTYYYGVRWLSGSGAINVRIRRSLEEISTPLSISDDQTATIDPIGKIVYYSFTPSETANYIFQSIDCSSGFDPYVILYDADFELLDGNDDGAGYPHFRISEEFTSGVTYYFAVKRLGDSSTGTVDVRLYNNSIIEIDADAVERDGSWTGTANIVSGGDIVNFSFSPKTTGTYIFESINADGDTYGFLYSEGLAGKDKGDDDSGSGRNFSISCELTADKIYRYGVRWFDATDTGEIQVRMRKDDAPPIPLDADAVENTGSTTATAEIVTAGQTINFSFTPRSSGTYVFESVNASGDTYGFLYSEGLTGKNKGDDDSGTGQNFRISCELAADKIYRYGVRWRSDTQTGAINVRMSKDVPDVLPAGVEVTLASPSIQIGDQTTANVRVTPDNATNKLVTWSSSNESVATVTSGIIIGISEGTADIIATAVNGVTGSATITVTSPEPDPEPDTPGSFSPDFTYAFPNSRRSFSPLSNYRIPAERYMQLGFTQVQAEYLVQNWGGSCFGMSLSSVLFYKGTLQEEKYDSNIHIPHDFPAPDDDSVNETKLRSMIELLQISQSMPAGTPGGSRYDERTFDPAAVAEQLDAGNPVGFGIRDTYGRGYHEVVIYQYSRSGSVYEFDIYDCSGFVNHLSYTDSSHYQFTYDNDYYDWAPLDYCRYDAMMEKYNVIKDNNYLDAASLLDAGNDRTYVYIFFPVGDMTITNAAGQRAVISSGGLLESEIEDVDLLLPGIFSENPRYVVIVPSDTYTITGPETITLAGIDAALEVSLGAGQSVTVRSDLHVVNVSTQKDEPYSISYKLYNELFETLTVQGRAGEGISTTLKDMNQEGEVDIFNAYLDVTGAQNITATVTVSGEAASVSESGSNGAKSTPFIVTWPTDGSGTTRLQVRGKVSNVQAGGNAMKTAFSDAKAADASEKGSEIGKIKQASAPNIVEVSSDPETGNRMLRIEKTDDLTTVYWTYSDDAIDMTADDIKTSGRLYSGPITVTSSTQVAAVAERLGYAPSNVATWKAELKGDSGDNPDASFILGDMDKNGDVTTADIGLLVNIVVSGREWTEEELQLGDFDRSGDLTTADVGLLVNMYVSSTFK